MITKQPKKFATEITDYAARRGIEGASADNLDVDIKIVGAGFRGVFSLDELHERGFIKCVLLLYEAPASRRAARGGGTDAPRLEVDSQTP